MSKHSFLSFLTKRQNINLLYLRKNQNNIIIIGNQKQCKQNHPFHRTSGTGVWHGIDWKIDEGLRRG